MSRKLELCLCAAFLHGLLGCDSRRVDEAALPAAAIRRSSDEAIEPGAIATPLAAEIPRAPRDSDWFEEMTVHSGIKFSYRNGQEGGQRMMLETLGGGTSLFDYDADGDLDIVVTGGGTISNPPVHVSGLPCALFRNDGDWKFTDVTVEAGLAETWLFTHGVSVGDMDVDGLPDLLITAYGGCRLYRNRGDGRFDDVTSESGLDANDWATGSAWADFDRDGDPDLYIASYLDWKPSQERFCGDSITRVHDSCSPTLFPGARDHLFRNEGNGRFRDLREEAGIATDGKGLAVLAADINQDGWIDYFVANDMVANNLYVGGSRLPFRDEAMLAGVALSESGRAEGSMGVDLDDFDGDGRPDLLVANYEAELNALYQNVGGNNFVHATASVGLAAQSAMMVGFGILCSDFDSDGWSDIFIANGHVRYELGVSPYRQPAQLYRNDNGDRFDEISVEGGPYFSVNHVGRGAAVGDIDNDGALDIVVVHQNDGVSLLRNRKTPSNWIRFRLRGIASDPLAIGASLSVDVEGRKITRFLKAGNSYLSHSDTRILLPLTIEEPVGVTVKWLTGVDEHFENLSPGETHVLVEGRGKRARPIEQP